MQKIEYKTVQIPKEAYELLKEYCDLMGFKMGAFVGKLIQSNCTVKKPGENVLRVETVKGSR